MKHILPINENTIKEVFTSEFLSDVISHYYPEFNTSLRGFELTEIINMAEHSDYNVPYRFHVDSKVTYDTESSHVDDTEYDTESPNLILILDEKFDKRFDSVDQERQLIYIHEIETEFPSLHIQEIKQKTENTLSFIIEDSENTIFAEITEDDIPKVYFLHNNYKDELRYHEFKHYLYTKVITMADRIRTNLHRKTIILKKLHTEFGYPVEVEHDVIYMRIDKKLIPLTTYKNEINPDYTQLHDIYKEAKESYYHHITYSFMNSMNNIQYFKGHLWIINPDPNFTVNYGITMPSAYSYLIKYDRYNEAIYRFKDYITTLNKKADELKDDPANLFICTTCHEVQPIDQLKGQVFAGFYCKQCYNKNLETKSIILSSHQRGFYE